MHMKPGDSARILTVVAWLALSSPTPAQSRDARDRSPPERGRPPAAATLRALPPGYSRQVWRGNNFYFADGRWYRPYGPGYRVVRPPRGLIIGALPPLYSSFWFGGLRYYYFDDDYYLWDPVQRGYVVSAPPAETGTSADELYVYPLRGQSDQQQATDRYECYRWAADQTGFDPTRPAGGTSGSDPSAARANYHRAETACLEGRGYSVK